MQNLVIVPTCLLAGCYFPYDIMPNAVQKVANFLPQRWLLDTIAKLQQGIPFSELYLNILILFAFAIAFFLIAIYKFGRNNDEKLCLIQKGCDVKSHPFCIKHEI